MATFAGRGAHTMNSMYFKPMLRKAFHKKSGSSDLIGDTTKLNAEEVKKSTGSGAVVTNNHQEISSWWVPDDRTGIFYPKGQEKVMENVSVDPMKYSGDTINWFSAHD